MILAGGNGGDCALAEMSGGFVALIVAIVAGAATATGTLPRSEAALLRRADAVRFLVIWVADVLVSELTRQASVNQTAG
jgi:hypothetical protein